jgi:hypothetical protein
MSSLNERRVCVKFCFKLGKTFTETFAKLQKVFVDETMSRTTTYEWYIRFKDGRTSIEEDAHFLSYEGVVHHEFVPQDQTVNKEFYLEVLRRLRESIR